MNFCRDCHWRWRGEGYEKAHPNRWLCAARPTDRHDRVSGEALVYQRCRVVRAEFENDRDECTLFEPLPEKEDDDPTQ